MTPDSGSGPPAGPTGQRARGLTQRALDGMFWTMSGTGVQLSAQVLTLMALGRLLTPVDFGIMGAAAVIVSLSQIVSQVGVGPAIIQRRVLEPVHVRVAVTLSCLLGLVLGLAVYAAAPAIARFYRIPEVEPVLRALAFLFPLDGLSTVGKSLLTRQLRFQRFVALDVGSYILGYVVMGVLLAWLGYGVWALVVANLSQVALRAVTMSFAARHPLRPSVNLRAAHQLLSFGFGHSMAQVGTVLSQQGDNLVVGRWLGPEALGVYGRAYNLMVMPASTFGRIVNRVLFPVMSQVQDQRQRLASGYERALAVVALFSLPISAFLWVVAPEFIAVLLGPRWGGVVVPFRLFTISLLFRMSSKISDACTKAAGKVNIRALLQFAYAAMVVTAALVGRQWGIGGVAVAVSLAMAANWLSMSWLSWRVTDLPWSRFARAHAPAALLAILVGGAAAIGAGAARAAHLGNIPVLAAGGLVALAVALPASRLKPALFLGGHGTWASKQVEDLLRRAARRVARADRLAPPAGVDA